jgi:hypothetical protein
MNKDAIVKYARSLSDLPGITSTRIESESLGEETQPPPARKRAAAPKKPEKARHVQYEDEIAKALKAWGNGKLESLYHSICTIDLDPHTPIVAIGVWAFFETLTACAGRNEGTSFDSFLGKQKLAGYGISDKAIAPALIRIREYGNTTKHHPVSGTFNGDQLNNDLIALKQVILKCIEEAVAKAK